MIIINSHTNEPYFNIATEEYIFNKFAEDILYLYVNSDSVVCGKHQNTLAEVDYLFAIKNNIPIIRRISGGGTVFHDLGNLNYCFINTEEERATVDFIKPTKPIIEVLNKMGIEAKLYGKSDIRVGELKISGNAQHIWKNKRLHHGTLLIDTDLEKLSSSITKDDNNFVSKAVKSNRANTINIKHLNPNLTLSKIRQEIIEHVLNKNPDAIIYHLNSQDIVEIEKLVETKYKKWEWNFAYSPKYKQKIELIEGSLILEIKDGIVVNIEQNTLNQSFTNNLIGKRNTEIYQIIDNYKR